MIAVSWFLRPPGVCPGSMHRGGSCSRMRSIGLFSLLAAVFLGWVTPVHSDETIALRSVADTRLVRAGVGDYSLLAAVSDQIGGWETFTLVDLGSQRIALRSAQNGKYVRAGVGSDSLLAAVSDQIGGWETFVMVPLPGDEIALQSAQSGQYVRAGVGQHSFLAAASSRIGTWERFTRIRLDAPARLLPSIPGALIQGLPPATQPETPEPPAPALPRPPFELITPPVVIQPSEPAGPQLDADRWIRDNLPVLSQRMGELGQATERSRRQFYGDARIALEALMRPAPAGTRDLLMDQMIAGQMGRAVMPDDSRILQTPDLSGVFVPPEIDTVAYLPPAEALEPDLFVLIRGSGFGTEPGRVYLTYLTGTGELGEGRTQRHAELEPLHGSWSQAWSDHQLAVQVPSYLPGGEDMGGTRDATLLVVRANGATAEAAVKLQGGTFPVITSVRTDRGTIGCCCPTGTEVWSQLPGSQDYVYWPRPVAQYAWQTPCGLEQWDWVTPGGTVVLHGKRFGRAENGRIRLRITAEPGAGPTSLGLIVRPGQWTDTMITAEVENVAITGYYQVRAASIDLETAYGRANPRPVAFGPEMDAKWVSGYRWVDRRVKELQEAVQTPSGDAMLVKHVPNCGMWGDKEARREKGTDQFFQETGYPDDVRITWIRFEHIDPEDPSDAWSVFGPQIWDLAGAIFNPASLITLGAKAFITGMVLSGEGGFHAYPPTSPKDGRFYIRWETSCSIGDGKPIIYYISFLIEGPPAALARY